MNSIDRLGLKKKCCVKSTDVRVSAKQFANGTFDWDDGRGPVPEVYQFWNITMSAEFTDNYPCCCECCEVRWMIKWDQEMMDSQNRLWPRPVPLKPWEAPHEGFMKDGKNRTGEWVEDRTQNGGRKGDGPRDDQKDPRDRYPINCKFTGLDMPNTIENIKGTMQFKLQVIDVCWLTGSQSNSGDFDRFAAPVVAESNVVTLNYGPRK